MKELTIGMTPRLRGLWGLADRPVVAWSPSNIR
jgi:hypothetical protein